MEKEYNFSQGKKNPYIKKLKKQITIKLDVETINYFKKAAISTSIPYQSLINLYLTDCANNHKKLHLDWK